eukprot:6208703-Pleurochrysis_carterae.AAC.3
MSDRSKSICDSMQGQRRANDRILNAAGTWRTSSALLCRSELRMPHVWQHADRQQTRPSGHWHCTGGVEQKRTYDNTSEGKEMMR